MLNWKEKLFYKDNFFLFQDFKEYIRTLEYQRTINYRVRDDFAWMQTEIERSQEVLEWGHDLSWFIQEITLGTGTSIVNNPNLVE